jgi:hypothetical protein
MRDLFDRAKHLLVSAMFCRLRAQTAGAVASYEGPITLIFFGWWDVAISLSEKRSVEAPFDARLAPETPELPPRDGSSGRHRDIEPVHLLKAMSIARSKAG